MPSTPAVHADATLTLALPKCGLEAPVAASAVGDLYLGDISIPPSPYVDPQTERMQSILRSAGPFSPSKFVDDPSSFRDYFGLVNLMQLDGTEIVEIGGQSVTDGFKVRKHALLQKVYRLTYLDSY